MEKYLGRRSTGTLDEKQANLIILIMILVILYIDNRYSSQQEMIEIDRLKKS